MTVHLPDSSDSELHGVIARPQWSLATNFWVAVLIIVLTTALVLLVLKKPVWVELEIAVGVVGTAMFLFYAFILYRGVSFKSDGSLSVKFAPWTSNHIDPNLSLDSFGNFASEGLQEGPMEFLIGLLLDILLYIVATILLALLLWLVGNIFFIGIAILAFPLFHIFKKSVFFVIRHSDECYRNLTASVKFAAGYALVKAAVLYLIVYLAHVGSDTLKSFLVQG